MDFKNSNIILLLLVSYSLLSSAFSQKDLSCEQLTLSEQMSADAIIGLTQDQHGYVYILSDRWLLRYDGIDFVNFRPEPFTEYIDILRRSRFTSLAYSADHLLIGTENGVLLFDLTLLSISAVTESTTGIDSSSYDIRGILPHLDDGFYFWTESELLYYSFSGRHFNQILKLPPSDSLRCLVKGSSYRVLMSTNNGLYSFSSEGSEILDTILVNPVFSSVHEILSVGLDSMLLVGENEVYLLHHSSLFPLGLSDSVRRHLDRFSTLSSVNGSTIVTANSGIYHIEIGQEWRPSVLALIDSLTAPLPQRQICQITENKFIYPGNGALYLYRLRDLETRINLSTPFIQRVRTRERVLYEPEHYKLRQAERPYTLDIGFVDFTIKDEYRLEYSFGDGGLWQVLNTNELVLPFLTDGKNEFRLRAKGADMNLSDSAIYTFHVVPLLAHRRGFQIAILAAVLITALLIYIRRNNVREKRKRAEELRNRKTLELENTILRTQMKPHFMFNSLNSIRNYILKNERELAADYLSEFALLIRHILNYSNKALISLDEELETLELYMRMERMRVEFPIEYQLDFHEEIDLKETLVPPLILQPFLENAIWHGLQPKKTGPWKIFIKISKENDCLKVELRDNGVGRKHANKSEESSTHKSMGLQITRQRLNLLQNEDRKCGFFKIKDLFEGGQASGTLVILNLPLLDSNTEMF